MFGYDGKKEGYPDKRYIKIIKAPPRTRLMYWEGVRDSEVLAVETKGDTNTIQKYKTQHNRYERKFHIENLSHLMFWDCYEKEMEKFLDRCEWVELTEDERIEYLGERGMIGYRWIWTGIKC